MFRFLDRVPNGFDPNLPKKPNDSTLEPNLIKKLNDPFQFFDRARNGFDKDFNGQFPTFIYIIELM